MLSCKDVTERAGALIDGDLPLVERAKLHAHLLVCVHCRRYVGQLRTTMAALRERTWAAASADSVDRAVALLPTERSTD